MGIREIDTDKPGEFERLLLAAIGSWLSPNDTVLLSGMITSRSGWQETPYIPCPAEISTLPDYMVSKTIGTIELIFLPGICQHAPAPDVMRGEELQLLGASLGDEDCIVVLPGTHSKWARVSNAVVHQFHTLMTGELFDGLMNHSLVGQISSSQEHHQEAFNQGVKRGFNSPTLINDLFALRASVLLGSAEADGLYSQLSGLLIGHEIREAQQLLPQLTTTAIVLVGNEKLCALYESAFSTINLSTQRASNTAAISGFQKVARSLAK